MLITCGRCNKKFKDIRSAEKHFKEYELQIETKREISERNNKAGKQYKGTDKLEQE